MSKTRDARGKGHTPSKQGPSPSTSSGRAPASAESAEVEWPPPLKPRRGLFILLAILLIALFAGMLVLYFKTVYPIRDRQPVEHDAPPAPPTGIETR